MTPEQRLERIARIIKLGESRLLAADGPVYGQPPSITLDEWKEIYALATGAPTLGEIVSQRDTDDHHGGTQ